MDAAHEGETGAEPHQNGPSGGNKKAESIWMKAIYAVAGTVLTAMMATGAQYFNSRHTTYVENAKRQLDGANSVKEAVMSAIERRYYTAMAYVPSVGPNQTSAADPRLPSYYDGLFARRFEEYHKETKNWNEGYDKLITSIDSAFDLPFSIKERTSRERIGRSDCRRSLVHQLKTAGFRPESLKVQLSAIDRCFFTAMQDLEAEAEKAWRDTTFKINPEKRSAASKALDDVRGLGNELRCTILFRTKFFQQQYERSQLFRNFIFDPSATEDELRMTVENGAKDCNFGA